MKLRKGEPKLRKINIWNILSGPRPRGESGVPQIFKIFQMSYFNYKKAIAILMNLLDKHKFDREEKEAVLTAIGVLDWANLGKNRMKAIIKARKAKRDKSAEW